MLIDRAVSGALESLCETLSRGSLISNAPVSVLLHASSPSANNSGTGAVQEADLEALLRTLRRLLVSVTQILLLADNVVVNQLLSVSKDKHPGFEFITMSTMQHFTEFVKAFCDFGSEMLSTVRIATGKTKQNHRAQKIRGQGNCIFIMANSVNRKLNDLGSIPGQGKILITGR